MTDQQCSDGACAFSRECRLAFLERAKHTPVP